MYKRILQVILIFAGLSLIGYVYYKFSKEEKDYIESIDAIPGNAAFILEINNFENLASYHSLFASIASYKNEVGGISFNPIQEWPAIFSSLDSLRSTSIEWNSLLAQSSVVFSCSEQGRADSWIMSIGLRKGTSTGDAENLADSWIKHSGTRDYKGVKIHQCVNRQYALIHDCLIFTSTGSLMEDVIIRNEKHDLISQNENLFDVRELASTDIPIHLYLKMNETDWLQLDPSFSRNEKIRGSDVATFSGYCALSDSSRHSFFVTGSENNMKIQENVPINTAILDIYMYPDFETGWRIHEDYYTGTTASKFWSMAWQDFGDTCQCDLNEAMLSWRSGEWGSAVIALNDSSTAELAFFGMHDSVDVIQLIRPLLVEQSIRPDKIYKIRYPQLFERNQQQSVLVECNYITQVNEFVFLAATPSELLNVMNMRDTLGKTEDFIIAAAKADKNTGRFIYQTAYYSSPLPALLTHTLGEFKYLSTHVEHLKENKYLVTIDFPFVNKVHSFETAEPPQANPTNLDSGKALRGPWTLINHNNQEKEQAIQNENKELCLMDKDGKVLWKKQLEEEIFGDIQQIDALQNGKLQMAFTTKDGLHILDRNGKELSGFPIIQKTPIAAPLHIADYDNNKKYRLLYAIDDGTILNYTVTGTPTEGWKHKQNFKTSCVDHFKIGKEDYLMNVSNDGHLEFLKRTGEVRFSTATQLIDYAGGKCEVIVGQTIESTKIQFTSKTGDKKTVEIGK